ncbi:hypothetical protein [Pseudogemmobacter humi]|uniref:Uncharacterized protein n=1 Tax=Pseudogemmobacter humi TaxID=2483812 RepID=A0A3P5X9Z9_9RHOB|nr:hypothetical protein [Pseudogemmobacter humi]VDC25267.1 hypothetical protein XINFAN_01505 [Pseudogemmobacter humi]
MELREFTLKLPEPTVLALRRIAVDEDASIGQIIREAIARDLSRRARAKTSVRTDERLVAPLRALLADDFAYAAGWSDLLLRLRRKGFRLEEAGGGLILVGAEGGARFCKASELGYSYAALLRRFDAPFPAGHRHASALDRIRAAS